MYPYLFEIGPISVGTFGLMVALGFLAALHVLNAPSPGATSSLLIGEHIASMAGEMLGLAA